MPNGIYPVPEIYVHRSPTDPRRRVQRLRIRSLWTRRRLDEQLERDADAASAEAAERAAQLRSPARHA